LDIIYNLEIKKNITFNIIVIVKSIIYNEKKIESYKNFSSNKKTNLDQKKKKKWKKRKKSFICFHPGLHLSYWLIIIPIPTQKCLLGKIFK
jgi:hypothetical protein